jgi:predicted permease
MKHLKEHAGEDGARRRSKYLPRNLLVSAQIALSLALLTAAALFLRGALAANAGAADVGVRPDRVFLVETDASLGGYGGKDARQLYRRLQERLGRIPGVESVSVSIDVPMSGLDYERMVRRGGGESADAAVAAKWNAVDENFFTTDGLPLLRGRSFSVAEASQADGPRVVIVDEGLAARLWPHRDPLGQRLELVESQLVAGQTRNAADHSNGSGTRSEHTMEVIGVARAMRHNLFEEHPDASLYLPFARGFQSHVFFHVKFAAVPPGDDDVAGDVLRNAIGEVDPRLPVLSLRSFVRHLGDNIQIWIVRAGAALFATFGGLALCLAVVGIYGVMAYSVARRTREIGIRMALGAQAGTVQQMFLREGGVMLAVGLGAGFLLSLGIGKVVSSLLYRVGAMDPVAFTVAPAMLGLTAFFACWLPARRATKVDPMVSLRAE